MTFHVCQVEKIRLEMCALRYLFHCVRLPLISDARWDKLAADTKKFCPAALENFNPMMDLKDPETYAENERYHAHWLLQFA